MLFAALFFIVLFIVLVVFAVAIIDYFREP